MVLSRIASCAVLAGCSQSLFDARDHRDGGTTEVDAAVPLTCTAPCVGDAAGDFDGTEDGANGRWRYLDDLRVRAWLPMTPMGAAMVGSDPTNRITSCTARPTSLACAALPGALLVTSAGSISNADPAIELTAPAAQVLDLVLRVHVPPGASQQVVHLYRNSREDVLLTRAAGAGVTLEAALTVDALAGDRFLLAIVPTGTGAAEIGVHLFATDSGRAFPATCQLAVSFAEAAGNTVDNLCGGDLTHAGDASGPRPPVLADGPFLEHGQAADLAAATSYAASDVLPRTGDVTLQFWVRLDALVAGTTAWAFSDLDLTAGGGLAVSLLDAGGLQLEVTTCTNPAPLAFATARVPYPGDGAWHFVRVVQRGGAITTCLDGVRGMGFGAAPGSLASTFPPHLGRNVMWAPTGSFFDGGLDDVRVFSAALPCP